MPTYLLEIGTEELPADRVVEAQERLKSLVSDALTQASLPFESVTCMGTPRRLACIIRGLASVQDTVKTRKKGPPVKSSFDESGNPKPAATGFARTCGLSVDKLERETRDGVEYLIADLVVEGKPAGEVLQEKIPPIIAQLSGERPMRWGDFDMKFSRPIRWLVSILDKDELPIAVAHIKSGRDSFGNRVLAPQKIAIGHPDIYVDSLRKARVLVEASERRELIEKQVRETAEKLGGKPRRLGGALLDEVINILEWPHPIVGEFGKEYLELPDNLIETVMVHHQRYFPVESAETGRLLPYFITVANNDRKEAEAHIKQGNERVIKARLADGRFFYFDDQKTKFADRKESLDHLTFQEGLGSYAKKTERLCKAAVQVSKDLDLESKESVCLERALSMCKLDLVTNLVRELPELQGHVGSWYAAKEGEAAEVTAAIASHYSPRFQGDHIPEDLVGRLAGVLDKLDSLIGLFALGRRPSGSSDPYALRRQAQGLVDILMDGLPQYGINLKKLMELFMSEIAPLLTRKKDFDSAKTLHDLSDFLMQRVRIKLQDKGIRRETIEAVCSDDRVLEDIPDALRRCHCLDGLIASDSSFALVRAGVRICNILSSDAGTTVNPDLFETEYEKTLWTVFNSEVKSKWGEDKFQKRLSDADYQELLTVLAPLSGPVDKFFEKTMVNDPDKAKKDNRHAILKNINRYFALMGNFKCFLPLLPTPVTSGSKG